MWHAVTAARPGRPPNESPPQIRGRVVGAPDLGNDAASLVPVARSSWPRLLDLIYWPTVQMVTWGFLQYYTLEDVSRRQQPGDRLQPSPTMPAFSRAPAERSRSAGWRPGN